jgi:hypothetical protein
MNKLVNILLIFALVFWLSSCALLDKLRGVANPHSEILIEVPTVTEDIRG